MSKKALFGEDIHRVRQRRAANNIAEHDNLVVCANRRQNLLEVLDELVCPHAVRHVAHEHVVVMSHQHVQNARYAWCHRSMAYQ